LLGTLRALKVPKGIKELKALKVPKGIREL
jgi:hypothetical protein